MPAKKQRTGTDDDLNMASMAAIFADENKAREFLEAKRWPNGPVCPHCESTTAYKLTAKPGSKKPVRAGVYKCKDCRKQFTVRVGTIFEDSKLPIGKWLIAIHLMTSSKKGVSSHQIARELGITVKSAWFVTHRIREAMKLEPMAGMLSGDIEADETYVGGKQRNPFGKRGRPAKISNKTPVVALVQRNGGVVVRPMPRVTANGLRGMMNEVVDKVNSKLHSDQLRLYTKIGREYGKGHGVVDHGRKEYVKGDSTINTAESFFALLKRGHYGTFHLLSAHHLHRYCEEFGFRWTHRKTSDGQRMVAAIKGAAGKRLMYRQPVGKTAPLVADEKPPF